MFDFFLSIRESFLLVEAVRMPRRCAATELLCEASLLPYSLFQYGVQSGSDPHLVCSFNCLFPGIFMEHFWIAPKLLSSEVKRPLLKVHYDSTLSLTEFLRNHFPDSSLIFFSDLRNVSLSSEYLHPLILSALGCSSQLSWFIAFHRFLFPFLTHRRPTIMQC